jgi:hypothetical protein
MQQRGAAGVMETTEDRPPEGAPEGTNETWVLFAVDGQIYALDLLEVERISPASWTSTAAYSPWSICA